MGRLTHAGSLRLVKTKNWLSRWQGKLCYGERVHKDLGFEEYVRSLLGSKKYKSRGLIYSHIYLSRKEGKVGIEIYVFDGR
jgi:hypothetical protein